MQQFLYFCIRSIVFCGYFSSATLPEGFRDVHQCFHIPLCDAERRCSEPVLCCTGKQASCLSRLQPRHNTNSWQEKKMGGRQLSWSQGGWLYLQSVFINIPLKHSLLSLLMYFNDIGIYATTCSYSLHMHTNHHGWRTKSSIHLTWNVVHQRNSGKCSGYL